ncbi:MAG: VWA domain-containing protein [Burkholderiales bacterium]|nr:VWA domain-containing protein [Burkholderiales bacterium]
MRFIWPQALWLLLFVPALVAAYLYALRRRKRAAIHYASLMLVRGSLGRGQALRRHLPPAIFLVAMSAAIFAIARPSAVMLLPSDYLTLILAMDVSRSMQATDVEPDRISAAQAAAKSFIEDLPRNVRLGIVSFAGTALQVQTPTENRDDMIAAIDRFQLQRGTATGSGLILSLAMLFPDAGIDLESMVYDHEFSRFGRRGRPLERQREEAKKAPKQDFKPVAPGSYTSGAIVLLSDGRRTTGPDPMEAAKMAAERGVRVFTVGFGTAEGANIGFGGWSFFARLDEPTLKAIAKATGGEYFHAGTAEDLKKIYASLSSKFALERRETEVSALFVAASLVLVLLAAALSLAWFNRGSG